MTRPRADSDGWLTDPISRDRVIAKAVVDGLRNITVLLRDIRNDLTATNLEMRVEMRMMREDLYDLRRRVGVVPDAPPKVSGDSWEHCSIVGCSLPVGHYGAHRGSRRGTGRRG